MTKVQHPSLRGRPRRSAEAETNARPVRVLRPRPLGLQNMFQTGTLSVTVSRRPVHRPPPSIGVRLLRRGVCGDEAPPPRHDVFPVRVLLEVRQVRFHATEEQLPLVQCTPPRVSARRSWRTDPSSSPAGARSPPSLPTSRNHRLSLLRAAVRQALLHHVTRELVPRERRHATGERRQHRPSMVRLSVLHDVLHDVFPCWSCASTAASRKISSMIPEDFCSGVQCSNTR